VRERLTRQMNTRTSQLVLLLLGSFIVVLIQGNPTPDQDNVNHGERLIEWLRSKGGYINPKLEIRRADPTDPRSRFGMFTNEKMKDSEDILIIPRECLITDEGTEYDKVEGMSCGTVVNLAKEMKLGDDSFYSTYVNYLLTEPSKLPSAWSNVGKKLLTDMQFKFMRLALPPDGMVEWIQDEWRMQCEGSTNPFEVNAALTVVARSWDNLLIPVYDMLNHRNGHWLNTKSNEIHGEEPIVVKAKRDIESGEELYGSCNMCETCDGRADTYGTFQILRDYGFVEQYPQRWIFPETVGFEIDEESDGSGKLTLSWIGPEPDKQDIEELEHTLDGMDAFSTYLETTAYKIKDYELATIREYHQSLLKAISLALTYAYGDENDTCSEEDETCGITADRYVDLNVETEDAEFFSRTCDNEDVMQFEDYDLIDEIKTPYQFISVMHDPSNNDMCFDLDNIVQIASSYRPQYHEMMVHYAARFLKDVKRVLFVGGGDAMLLHEIVKYPNLELVVGLELDQQVPRMSFKYFGVQPLWDNEKVQWWFGDATKSLLMLPKEYFGTFDMVLVDLSETVMSFKVTDEMDIVEALSLLLKPDGIMVKNELYFEDMSGIFEHTLQIRYVDVPVICSQAMVLGSNNIDFLRQNMSNHGIDSQNLYIMPEDEQFNIAHDYAWNPSNLQKHCKREDDELNEKSAEQTRSPGIIMCIEAEEASLLVSESLESIAELVVKTLEKEGLTLLSTFVPETKDNAFAVIMKEGYVMTRLWSKEKYCAFDIHLWSSFEKHESVKKALISSVGSSPVSSSSFRVVAGGMFGVDSWKNDKNKRGPIRTDTCERPKRPLPSKAMNQDAIDIILKESMTFSGGQGGAVVVVCGEQKVQPCGSLEALQKVESLENLHVLWTCIDNAEDAEDYPLLMHTCEQEVLQLLEQIVSKETKISAVVFDHTMEYKMGQVMLSILKKLTNQRNLFTPNVAALEISDDDSEAWRRNLISRIHQDVHYYDPVFRAQILYIGSDSNVEVNVVTKDKHFIENLKKVRSSIEKEAGIVSDIRTVTGGLPHFDHDFIPKPFYKPSDYDQSLPAEQWSSQKPLEHQTIFQLEGEEVPISTSLIMDGITKTLTLADTIDCPSSKAEIEVFSDVGDGCVVVAFWSGGKAVVVWDGRNHIDINLSILAESNEFAAKFDQHFMKQLPFKMKTVLRDIQSRGYGRVVSYLHDTNSGHHPHWITVD